LSQKPKPPGFAFFPERHHIADIGAETPMAQREASFSKFAAVEGKTMDQIKINVVLYQEDKWWIAQGLEFDISAQASSLPELHNLFAMKVATEIAISQDLKIQPLAGIAPAPDLFWQMFKEATMEVSAGATPVRIEDGPLAPHIISCMKIGQRAEMAA